MAQEKAMTSACPHCCHQFKVVGLGMQFCFAPSCLHARVMTLVAAATKHHRESLPAASAAPDMRHSRPRRRVACGILCHAPRQCCHAAAAGGSTWGRHQHAARGRGQLQRLPCHCQQPGGIQVSSSLHGPLAMRPCQSVAHAGWPHAVLCCAVLCCAVLCCAANELVGVGTAAEQTQHVVGACA
jgi:hypothetical protein